MHQRNDPTDPFLPPRWLRNPHLQSILSSSPARARAVAKLARDVLQGSNDHVLDCGDGVRLLGHYTPAASHAGERLAVLLHGWEGCAQSNYILSMAAFLYRHGYSVFRLNLRDHGRSHHLNRELYNSTRLAEVQGAMEAVQRLFPHRHNYFIGYSLGGNFGLRIGAHAAGRQYHLDRIVAVCPVISPPHVMANLERSPLYHSYFVRKWQRSLRTKLQHYPDLGYRESLLRLRTLASMNDYFVPRHTDYDDSATYLEAYGTTGDTLASLAIPTHILTSEDDPIVRAEDLALATRPPALTVETTRYGGHCGFLHNLHGHSWMDRRIAAILADSG